MISSRQRRILAIVLGIILAGAPVVGFQFWLQNLVERQGAEEVAILAKRAVGVAEARIDRVARSLEGLAKTGINSCSGEHLDALRRAAFATAPVKELSIVDPRGQVLCSDLTISTGPWRVVNPQTGSDGDVLVEVLQSDKQAGNMVRIRRVGPNGAGIAALVPAELLVLQVSGRGGPFTGYERLSTRDGTYVGGHGAPPVAGIPVRDLFMASGQSDRYGLSVAVSVPRTTIAAGNTDIRTVGTVVTGILSLALFALALIFSRRQESDPITEIRRAIEANEFAPYYQPIVDITSARLLGSEVLVRWCKPDGTVVPPGAFIPLLEQSGLVIDLTRRLMRRVCDEMGEVYVRRPHLKVSFNLTAQHFRDDSIVNDIKEIFSRSKIHLTQVVLELTERQPLENLATTRRIIAELQSLGCQVALDDVGTGHSGLSSILKLGVDVIKVDKIFVDSISTERNSAAIVETLVDLARHMRMDIIAEGVENFEQVADLRERGIRAAQGYVFAPPLPGPLFLQLLEASDPLPSEPSERHADMPQYISARNRIVAA